MLEILIFTVAVVAGIAYYFRRNVSLHKSRGPFASALVGGPEITPVAPTFDWKVAQPLKFRPFKPKFNLTMGISKPHHNDWLLIENTYLDRVLHHKQVFAEFPDETALCNPGTETAVAELYDYVVEFLTARYPHYFVVNRRTRSVLNKILNESFPASAMDAAIMGYDSRKMLRIIGEHTEEDFLLLKFDPAVEEYRLEACTGIAANGFLWKSRMGMNLTSLHGPIPQYKERLQFSMNKYFRKMTPKDLVQRTTFKVQLSAHDAIFLPEGNASPSEDTNFQKDVHMRLERQQLFRLPKSHFILFTIRTYMYPISDVKDEGLGNEMAAAIRAWSDDFAKYKHREDWGAPTLTYLESKA